MSRIRSAAEVLSLALLALLLVRTYYAPEAVAVPAGPAQPQAQPQAPAQSQSARKMPKASAQALRGNAAPMYGAAPAPSPELVKLRKRRNMRNDVYRRHQELGRPHVIEDLAEDVWPLPQRQLREICRGHPQRKDALECLPNVVFLGVSKCGTTTFNSHLAAISSGPGRGLLFATNREADSLEQERAEDVAFAEYKRLPTVPKAFSKGDHPTPALLHYRPRLLIDPNVPMRIREAFPRHHQDMRFVVMVRDPAKRAVSSYWYKTARGNPRDAQSVLRHSMGQRSRYEACMRDYMKRRPKITRAVRQCRSNPKERTPREHVDMGFYAHYLQMYFEYFEPSHFLVFSLEEFSERPKETLSAVLRFMGVDPDAAVDPAIEARLNEVHNQRAGNPPLPNAFMKDLYKVYGAPNKKLRAMLGGKDFGYW